MITWNQTGTVALNFAPPLPFAEAGSASWCVQARLLRHVARAARRARARSSADEAVERACAGRFPAGAHVRRRAAAAPARPSAASAASTAAAQQSKLPHRLPPSCRARTPRGYACDSVATRAVRVARVELTARIATLRLAETFVISRESQDEADVVQVELRHDGVDRLRRGARRSSATTRRRESALAYVEEHAALLGDDPFALEEIEARLPRRSRTRPGRRSTARSTTCRGSCSAYPCWRLLGLPRTGPPTSWTVWLGIPTTWPGGPRRRRARFRRLKLKLGGADGLDVERVRAVRGVTELPLQVDVNEWWSLDEALDALPQLAELGVAYCEQPLPAGDEGGADAEAAARRSRSTSTRTATASATSPPAPRSRTGSTSSSRSRAGSARRSGWRTPPARSGSASCSAA